MASQVVQVLVATFVFYTVLLPLYRLFFSPLAKFPGPKLAAATLWYEFYYDVILQGHYTFKLMELHKQYGPIIRISPFELHINDPSYFEVLYSNNLPLEKSTWYINQFDIPGATFATIPHTQHRHRRAAIAPYFSTRMILKLEPFISSLVTKLCTRISEHRASGQPVSLRPAYSALTTDVVAQYCFNKSWDHLGYADFYAEWQKIVNGMLTSGNLLKQAPWLYSIIRALPVRFVEWLNPSFKLLFDFENSIKGMTDDIVAQAGKGDQGMEREATVFHALLNSDLPPEDKTQFRMWQEGSSVIGAGSETTANVLVTVHFHLLSNPELLARLQEELREALPDKDAPVALGVVEKLPYLNAVINEGLRLGIGVSNRLARVHPTKSMKYGDWEIPAGTSVGMTLMHIHQNEKIYPEPKKFEPARWLDQGPGRPLERYLVPFSKGTRQCVGLNLAKAELYLVVASVFRKFDDMELFETTSKDVDFKHDFFGPFPDLNSKGVRVLFK